MVRGVNTLLAIVSTEMSAPVVVAHRLRKGASGSPRGAARFVADALKTVTRSEGQNKPVPWRVDSAHHGFQVVNATPGTGAQVSITARQDPAAKRAIATIPETAWTTIDHTDAIFDDSTNTEISRAEVAEVFFTAFTSRAKKDHIAGRLRVRRIPDLNKKFSPTRPCSTHTASTRLPPPPTARPAAPQCLPLPSTSPTLPPSLTHEHR